MTYSTPSVLMTTGFLRKRLVEKDSGIRAADMPGSLFREKLYGNDSGI